MTEFEFDIQRFANHYIVTTTDEFTTALSRLADGDVITLNADINVTGALSINKDVTIYTNGHTIRYTADGTLTIAEDADVEFSGGGSITAASDATVTITVNGTITWGNTTSFTTLNNISSITYVVGTVKNFNSAISNAKLQTTPAIIKLTADIVNPATIGTIGADLTVTVNLDGNSITYNNAVTRTGYVAENGELIFTGGSIIFDDATSVTLTNKGGTLTFDNMKTVEGISINASTTTGTTTFKSSTVTLYDANSLDVRLPKDNLYTTYTAGSGTTNILTLVFDSDGGVKYTGLAANRDFTIERDGAKIFYTVTSAGLKATQDSTGIVKVLPRSAVLSTNEFSMSDLSFTDKETKLQEAVLMDSVNANFTFKAATTGVITEGDEVLVVSCSDYSKTYATLTKKSAGKFTLKKTSAAPTTWTSVTINDGSTVEFSSDFKGTEIAIVIGKTTKTTFRSITGGESFTVSGTNYVSVAGATNVSLGDTGTIQTDDYAQTVTAGNYSVGGYSYNDTANDGINIAITDGGVTQVSDIEKGESFNVNGTVYTRNSIGLTTSKDDNIQMLYTGTVESSDGAWTVDLSRLKSGMRKFIAPSASAITLGGDNYYSAVVLDSTENLGTGASAVKYAELTVNDDNTYYLGSIAGGNQQEFRKNVNVIYLDGVTASIEAELIGSKDSDLVDNTIEINTRATKFIVTECSNDVFSVNGSTDYPEIIGAKSITLLKGTITTYVKDDDDGSNTTIVIGDKDNSPVLKSFSNAMTVTLRKDGKITVRGTKGDEFVFNDKNYSILDGDGMTFTFNDDDSDLIFSDLSVTDGDAFTYAGNSYSVKGAGFIRNGNYMWINHSDSSHTLTGGSVSIAELNNTANWGKIITVDTDDNYSVSLPSVTDKITLVGDDYEKIYGVFTGASGAYYLDNTTETVNTATLGSVSVRGMGTFSATAGYTDMIVNAEQATFAVTNDDGDGWNIMLSDGAASAVSEGETVTLLSGSFQVDSYTKVNLDVANSIISAGGSNTDLIVKGTADDATISGLTDGEIFRINGRGDYTQGTVGLYQGGKYLRGSKGGTVVLSHISTDSMWGNLISASALTIDSTFDSSLKNALITDSTVVGGASILYADLVIGNDGITLSKSAGGVDWYQSGASIYVNNVAVNFTKDFAGVTTPATIVGIQSDAIVNVTEAKDFTFTDAGTGAVIGSVSAYSLSNGIVSVTANQTVTANTTVISADTGDVTFNVVGTSATIGAIDKTDVFSVNGTKYHRYGVGIMTDDGKLLTELPSNESVTVDELDSKKINTVNFSSDSVLAIAPTVPGGTSYPLIILDPDNEARYGMIETVRGGYSIYKSDADLKTTPYTIAIDGGSVTLTPDFLNVNLSCANSEAVFSVKGTSNSGNFSVYDVGTGAEISENVTSIVQTAGLIAPKVNQTIRAGEERISRINEAWDIWVTVDSGAATITGVDSGEIFSINGLSYGLLPNGRFVRLSDNKIYNGDAILNGSVAAGALTVKSAWNDWDTIATSESGVLTIDDNAVYGLTAGDAAFVVGSDSSYPIYGVSFPTKIYGTLTYTDENVYSLTIDGRSSGVNLTGVVVTNKTLPVKFSTAFRSLPIYAGSQSSPVAEFNVTGGNSFTVTYKSNEVSLDAAATAINLTDGTLYISDSAQTVTGGKIKVVAGGTDPELTVNYSASTSLVTVGELDTAGEFVTINSTNYGLISGDGFDITVGSGSTTTLDGMNVGDRFYVGSTSYMMTSIGLATNDKTKLNNTVSDSATNFTTDKLAAQYWNTIKQASGGSLSITTDDKLTDARVVDLDDPANASTYGTLTYSGSIHTFTYGGSSVGDIKRDIKLTSIDIGSGVYASLDSVCSDINITALDATFTASASSHFIVNAQSTYASVGAPINLTAGTVQGGHSDNTVTVNGRKIFADNSAEITVGLSGTKAFVGGLDNGEIFYVDDVPYKMTATGIFKNDSLLAYSKNTYTSNGNMFLLDDENLTYILSVSGTNLDLTALTDQIEEYSVYNADETTQLGTLYVSGGMSLHGLDSDTSAANIKTIDINATTFNVDFTTKVHAPSGIVTVNKNMYTAVGDITINAASESSTLYEGMVALASDDTVQATSGDTLKAVSGSISASVTNGNLKTIYDLDPEEIFEFGGYTYTQTEVGLIRNDGSSTITICESLSGASLAISDLSTKKFENLLAVVDGELDLSTVSGGAQVYDSNTAPTKKYATLTVNSTRYILNGNGASASAIENVGISAGTVLDVKFDTKVSTSTGTVTVNDNVYNATGDVVIDATSDDSSLYTGTVSLTSDESVKASNGTLTAGDDSTITATADRGTLKTVESLDAGEIFTFNGSTYTQTQVGLTIGGTIREDLKTSTVRIADLSSATWKNYIQTDSSDVLALSKATVTANIYNASMSGAFGAVTVSGSDYTFDYAGLSVRSAVGNSVTVNGAAYTGATALIINTTDDSSTLYGGTASITSGDTVTAGDNTVGVSGAITATATAGTWTSLGSLDSGDEFTVDGTTYKVIGTDIFKGTDSGELYTGESFRNGTIPYSELASDFSTIWELDDDGYLDLTEKSFPDNDVIVVENTTSTQTTRVAGLSYASSTYVLSTRNDGVLTNFAGVKLGSKARNLTTDIETTVLTDDQTTYTVNGASFVALGSLSIAAADNSATLNKGKVSLRENSSVTVTDGDIISATTGTITVDVADSDNVTIGALNNADVFSVSGTSYLKTSIGLATGDTKKLNASLSSASVTASDLNLSGSDWKNVLDLKGSTLSVDASTQTDVFVVDLSTPANAALYGYLTKDSGTYNLDATNNNATLEAVNVTGTKLTLPVDFKEASINAGGASFTVTATSAFTIDASNEKPTVSDVTSVYLTAGELIAPYNVPVSVNGKTITATNSSDEMTIGIDDSGTFIGELNAGDTFTIGNASYEMTSAGLFKNGTQRVYALSATWHLDEDTSNIINVVNNNLDLTNQTDHADVYNEAKTVQIGSLSVVGSVMTLAGLSSAPTTAPANIKTVDIATGTDLTVDFATKVSTSTGTVTVNDNQYTAVGSIVIDATEDDSSLYGGTVALTSGESVQASNGDTVKTDNGTINVTAALGKVSQFSDVDTGESFTFGGSTYTQADMGLMYGDTICESLNGTFTAANLNNGKFVDILTPVDGELDLSTITASGNVYDDADSPAVKYAALTVSKDNTRYTLNDSGSASTAIENVDITAGKTLTVDFSTMVNAPTGTVTVNGDKYNAVGSIVISAVKDDSTLYDGIVTLDKTNPTASATYNGSLTVSDGSISATATLGYFTAISGLDTGESFTFDGTTYTQTDIGLRNGSFVAEALSGSEITLDDLDNVTWNHYLSTDKNGVLALSDVDADDADVYNYDLTSRLATVSMSGTSYTLNGNGTSASGITLVKMDADETLTIDFATQVSSPKDSSVTVNGAAYTGTTTLLIDTTADSSTLTTGTVSLASGSSVATTSEHNIANTAGDGLTVNASGSAVTIGELNSGDAFTADNTNYQLTDAALFNTTAENIYTATSPTTITLETLTGDDDWNNYLTVVNGTLNVTDSSLSTGSDAVIVSDDLSTVFGTLANESGTYKFTDNDLVNGALSTINIISTVATFDADFADVATFTANDSTFADVTVGTRAKTFTVTATDDVPRFSDDVKSLTLAAGEVYAVANQTVTAGNHVITPTTVANATISLDDISGLEVGDTFTLDGDTYTYVADLGLFNTTDTALVTDGFSDGTLTFGYSETQVLAPVNGVLDFDNVTKNSMLIFDSATNPTKQLGTVTKSGKTYTIDYTGQVRAAAGSVTVNGAAYTGTTTLILDVTPTTSTLTTGTVSLASGDSVNTTSEHAISNTAGDGLTVNASGSAVTIGELNSGDAFTADDTNYQLTDAALFNTTDENIYTATSPTTITLDELTGDDDWNNYLTVANGTLNVTDNSLSTGSDAVIVSDDLSKVFGTLANESGTYKFTDNDLVNGALSTINIVSTVAIFDADFADVATFTANDSTFADVTVGTRAKTFTVTSTDDVPRFSDDVKSLTLAAGEVYAVANQTVTAGNHVITPTTVANATISLDDISGLSVGDTFTLDGDTYTYVSGLGLFNTTDTALVTDGFSDGTLTFGYSETQVLAPVNGVLDLDNVTKNSMLIFDSATNPTKQLGTVTKSGKTYTLDYTGQVSAAAGSVTVNGAAYTGTTTLIIDVTPTTSTLTTGTVSLASGSSVATTSEHNIANTAGDGLTVNASGSAVTFGELNSGDSFTADNVNYQLTDAALFNTTAENIYTATSPTTITLETLTGDDDWNNYLTVANRALNVTDSSLSTGSDAVIVSDDLSTVFGTLANDSGVYKFTANSLVNGALSSINIVDTAATFDADFADVETFTANDSTFTDVTVNTRAKTFTVTATDDVPRFSDDVKSFTLTAGEVQAVAGQTVTAGNHVITPTTVANATISLDDISGLSVGDTFTLDGDTYIYVDNLGLFNTTDTALVTDGFSDGTLTFGYSETQVLAPVNGVLDLSNVTKNNMLIFDSATNPTKQLGTVTKSGKTYTLDYAGQVRAAAGTVTVNGAAYTGTTELILDVTPTTSTLTTGTVSLSEGDSVNTTSEHTVANTAGDGLTVNASGSAVTFGELNSGDSFTADDVDYQITDAALFNTTAENIYTATSPTTITLETLTGDDDWNNYLTVTNGTLNVTDALLPTADADDESEGSDASDATSDVDNDAVIVSDDLSTVFGTLANESGTYRFTDNDLVNGALSTVSVVDTVAIFDDDFADVATFEANDSTFTDVTVGTRAKTFTVTATDDVPRLSDDVKSLTLTAGEVYAVANQTVTAGNHVITPTTVANATISLDDISGLSVGDTFTLDGDTYTYVDKLGLFNTTDTALVTDGFSDGTLTFGYSETQVLAPVNGILDLSNVTKNSMLIFDSATNPTKQLGTVTRSGKTYTLDYTGQVSAPSGTVTVNGAAYTGTTELIIDVTPTTSTLTTGTVSLSEGDSVNTTSEHAISNTAGDGLTVNASGSEVTFGELNSGDSFTVDDVNYTVKDAGPMNSAGALWRGGDYSDGLTITALETASNWREPLAVSNKDLFVDTGTLVSGEEVLLVDSTTSPTETYGTLSRNSDGRYKLTVSDGDALLSGLTVSGVVMDVDNDLASDDVKITTVNADNSETAFTVSPARGTEYFTVDATGDVPNISDAGSVEITSGKVSTDDGIPVTPAEGADNPTIVIGNGTHKIGNQTVTLADNDGDAQVTLGDDGTISSINPLDKDATVTIDGDTYTSPADGSTLNYNDADGWYFDDYVPASGAYTITVDKNGNITVDKGVKFTDVVSSGRTLPTNSTIQLAAVVNSTPITLINNGTTAINLTDADGNSLVANLGKIGGVLFDGDGAEFDSLDEARGATFTLDDEQSLTAGTTVITANDDDVEVTIGRRNRLSIQGDISAINATIDLSNSDTIKFDGMSLSGAGYAIFDDDGDLTVTDGTTATSATGKTFTIEGTVIIDGKTVNADALTALTATARGLTVGKTALTVTGDDAYTVNIDDNASITGVENLGSATGVTVGGLTNATLLTDTAGALTVDKTFASGASVLYTVRRGKVTAADGVTTISGDFANGVAVNDTPYTISGGTVTIDASTGNVSTGAGTYDVNGKTYTTSATTTFTLTDGTVTGADIDGLGNFAIHQDETAFALDDDTLSLSGNDIVTLGVSSDSVNTADGVEGVISGLGTATVNDIGDATINGTAINIDGDTVTALVANGTVTALTGANDGATITSAPNMTITASNGSYNFPNGDWSINDTVDGSADFLTDGNTNVIGVDNIAGSINGASGSVTINDADFGTTSDNVTVTTDGADITGVYGLSSGDSVGGSLSQVTFDLPEGGFTINGAAFTLSGDSSVTLTDDGKTIDGMDTGSVITLGAAGEYAINGTSVTAEAGDVYAINRDGLYRADTDNMPITEGTPYANILALGASSSYIAESASGAQSITLGNRDEVALIDSPDASTNVTTGSGNDSVVVRHGAQATVDTANGDNTLVITNGKVTLENYSASNATVQTFDYSNVPAAVKNNSIKFGDGVMTLGDGVITFDASATVNGATLTEIIDAAGNAHNIGFTHTAGGTLNTSAESANYLLKGNYAEKTSDAQKSAGSTIYGGSGNDTLLIGANDLVNAGGGTNQIYITDPSLRSAAATIILSDGTTNVRNFNDGFNAASDVIRVSDMGALEFGTGAGGFTMTLGDAQLTFSDLTPAELVSVNSANTSMNADGGYEFKVSNGSRNYNVAVAQENRALAVTDAADVYYGNPNGLSFTEYAGTVAVNLSNGTGTIGGTAASIYGGANKLAAGSGDATLTGSDGNDTLYGGLGNATLNGGAGADLMIGNTSSLKSGSTKFVYTGGNGLDTIRNMDFMANAGDGVSDEVLVDVTGNVITSVNVNGSNVSIGLNGTAALTILNARGQHFKFNDLVTKVDNNVVAYDGYTDCYVGVGSNPTVSVGANMGNVAIWLNGGDELYLGDIAAINASAATGNNTLSGNDVNNLIVGGRGKNSIWGGEFATNDTLVGGSGQNTFFFQDANGTDIVQNAHDGDVVELVTATLDKISSTAITGNGLSIDFKDGSRLEVQSAANVEYKLADGTSYTADHTAREWRQK